ncbi:hypothetical protein PC119_g22397 [Phytophthora cactorum]|nr:hypothetical protein PC119_g22397 [Phytophthora cactorum]
MSLATALGSTLFSVFLRCEKAGLIHWNRARMAQLENHHYDDATRSDKPGDDDQLVHLDEHDHREQEMLNKRCKQNSDGDASVQEKKIKGPHTVRFTTQLDHPFCYYRDPLNMWHHSELFWENNHLCADVVPNESMLNPEFLNNDVDHSFFETVEDNTGGFEQGMNKEQQNVCGGTNASCVMSEKDESYLWSVA